MIYGRWAGCPAGTPEDPTRCIEQVWSNMVGQQCGRRRGYGKDGQYCKQHAKMIEERERRSAAWLNGEKQGAPA